MLIIKKASRHACWIRGGILNEQDLKDATILKLNQW